MGFNPTIQGKEVDDLQVKKANLILRALNNQVSQRIFKMQKHTWKTSSVLLTGQRINVPGHKVKTIPLANGLACVNACSSMKIDVVSFVLFE